jgi:hypothetical protein
MNLDTRNGSNPTARLMTWEREIMLERQREGRGSLQGAAALHRPGQGQGTADQDEPDRSGQDPGGREVVSVPADLLTAVSCYGSRSGMVTVKPGV